MCFDYSIILFPYPNSKTLPASFTPTYPPTSSFSLFLPHRRNRPTPTPPCEKQLNKLKKKNNKTKLKTKHLQKSMEFVLCWLATRQRRPALECAWYTWWHSIGENSYPFGSWYWSQVPPWLELGLCVNSPFSVQILCLVWTCSGLVRVVSMSSAVCPACCVWKTLFPWSGPPPLALNVPPPLPQR